MKIVRETGKKVEAAGPEEKAIQANITKYVKTFLKANMPKEEDNEAEDAAFRACGEALADIIWAGLDKGSGLFSDNIKEDLIGFLKKK